MCSPSSLEVAAAVLLSLRDAGASAGAEKKLIPCPLATLPHSQHVQVLENSLTLRMLVSIDCPFCCLYPAAICWYSAACWGSSNMVASDRVS